MTRRTWSPAPCRPCWRCDVDPITGRPKHGDLAWHVDGHDPRRVTKFEQGEDGEWYVYLWLLTASAGPFPAENYTFTREEEG